MKKVIQLSLVLLSNLVVAQNLKVSPKAHFIPQQKYFNACTYQVEKTCYVLVNDVAEASEIRFYSSVNGGKLVSKDYADSNGNLSSSFTEDQMPAFALNRVKISEDKIEARTEHFDEKEFIVKKIKFNTNDPGETLSFEAIRTKDKLVTCKIHQVTNSGAENLVEEFPLSEQFDSYLLDLKPAINTRLKLGFYSDNLLRYSVLLKDENPAKTIAVFPSITSTYLNINLVDEPSKANYLISSLNGQVVLKGKLNMLSTKLDVSGLQPGTYVVSVELAGTLQRSVKFVKH